MGYLSEVGICLAGTAQAKLEADLLCLTNGTGTVNVAADKADSIRELFQSAKSRKDEDSGSAAYYWPSLKWYDWSDDYPGVRFVDAFLEELDEEDYLFIRVGESDDDNEIKGVFWENPFLMGFKRSIVFE